MSDFLIAVQKKTVTVVFTHYFTGIEITRKVTLCPALTPNGISVGVSAACTKVPLWDVQNKRWMDVETSTITSWY